jgi:next-to-BRCA1 protein 1
MENTLVVKLSYDGTLRRITMPKVAEPSFATLEHKVRELFNLPDSSAVLLAYTDNDGDVVTMVDDSDLKDAIVLQQLNPLRVAVKVKKASVSIRDSILKEKAKRQAAAQVPPKEETKSAAAETKEAPKEAPKPSDVPLPEELKRIQGEVRERLETVLKGAAGNVEGFMASFEPFLQVAPARLAEVMHLAMKSGLQASFEPHFETATGPAAPAQAESAPASPSAPSAPSEVPAEKQSTEPKDKPETSAAKETAQDTSSIVHTGVQCDVCSVNPIVGPRYKSIVRNNYDLCNACYAKNGVEGNYNKIERPLFRPRMHPFWGHGGGPLSSRMGMRPGMRGPPVDPYFGGRPFYQGRTGGCGRFGNASCNPDGKLDARFVRDVTIFDGTELAPATSFTKIWRLRNSGSLPWPQYTQLVHVGGDHLGSSEPVTLQLPEAGLAPGEEVDVSVDLLAPEKSGRYVSHWRLLAPGGPRFGHRVWALVQVVPADEPSPQVAESVAQASSDSGSTTNTTEHTDHTSKDAPSIEEPFMSKNALQTVKEVPVQFTETAPVASQPQPAVKEEGAPALTEPVASPTPESPKTEVTSVGGFSLVDRPSTSQASSAASDVPVQSQQTSFVLAAPSAPKDSVAENASAPPGVEEEEPVQVTKEDAEALSMETMLTHLEAMGFLDRQLNEELLKANDLHLQQTLDELVGASEWDPIMVELEEMGFYDKDVNRRLMFKNKGSVKRVVKELVEQMKRSEQ